MARRSREVGKRWATAHAMAPPLRVRWEKGGREREEGKRWATAHAMAPPLRDGKTCGEGRKREGEGRV